MLESYLRGILRAMVPMLLNHLWQSTLCLVVAGLLALILRKNHARVRYSIWLAASLKFLIPFSLLIAVGARLAPPRVQSGPAPAGAIYLEMQQVGQPFTPTPMARLREQHRPDQPNGLWWWVAPILPSAIFIVWMGGFLFVLARWSDRWWQISKEVAAAMPLRAGREVEALRRIERLAGVQKPIEMRLLQASLEPGIFGVFRPVLVWPAGISGRLENAELEAILSHEAWHVRRRDNLTAAIHMFVEALFWYHPLVWWLGARLVEEREGACDEEVVQLGGSPHVYAESILKTCQFCLESPLACVSGVTGAELKDRITGIMTGRFSKELSLGKKSVLILAGAAAVIAPVSFGLLNAPVVRAQFRAGDGAALPSFEVASIKLDQSGRPGSHFNYRLGRLSATGVSVESLIRYAYNVQGFQVSGEPGWLHSEKYDIEAKDYDAAVENLPNLPPQEREAHFGLLMQSLLANRFKLRVRHETKELPIFVLVVAKNGPRMKVATPGDTYPNGYKGPDGKSHSGFDSERRGELHAQAVQMEQWARYLPRLVGRTVLDQTGLKDDYDFLLKWSPEENSAATSQFAGAAPLPDTSGPSIFTALQEQLGLKLESTRGPVEVLVIEHVERPTEN